MKPERMSRSVQRRMKHQRSWADLESYVRAMWSSAHAQRDLSSSYEAKQEYVGCIRALEGVAFRIGIDLHGEPTHEA